MKDVTIRLYGPIGGWFGFGAEEILEQIPPDAEHVTLRIHSPGGSVGEGIALYRGLKDHPARITTIVDGMAASMATVVMLAGVERVVHRGSMGMVHNPWTMIEGNSKELRKGADVLDKYGAAIIAIYNQETGLSETELRALMDADTYMTGADLMEKGFADRMIDDESANNAIAAMLKNDGWLAAKMQEADMAAKAKGNRGIEGALADKIAECEGLTAQLAKAEGKVIELEDATPEAVADLENDVVKAAIEKATVEAKAEIEAKIEEIKAESAKFAAAQGRNINALHNMHDEAKAELTIATEKADKASADLVIAKGMLANPALINDAALAAMDIELASGDSRTDAEIAAEDAKIKAAADGDKSDMPKFDEFCAIRDSGEGRAATKFWNEHKEEINAEQRAFAAKGDE